MFGIQFDAFIVFLCFCYASLGHSVDGDSPSSISSTSSATDQQRQINIECTTCAAHRARQLITQQEVQQDKLRFEQEKILSKLRLQKAPDIHLSIGELPSPLIRRLKAENDAATVENDNKFWRLFHREGTEEDETENEDTDDRHSLSAKIKGVYIFGQRPRSGDTYTINCPDPNGRISGCVEFKMNNELLSRHVTSASLWLYKTSEAEQNNDDGNVKRSSKNSTLHIVEIQRHHHHNGNAHSEYSIASIPIDGLVGWLEIDCTDYISRWRNRQHTLNPNLNTANHSSQHHRLRISCSGCSNSARPPVALHDGLGPFLDVKLGNVIISNNSNNNRRRRRRTGDHCSPDLYNNCCLKPFYVNFTEIGWNSWILQPPGYYANYCTGSCRMTATTSYNNVIRNVGNTKEAKGEIIDRELVPCCAPTKMSPLSLLYAFSHGEIMKKTLDNMIVESCGC